MCWCECYSLSLSLPLLCLSLPHCLSFVPMSSLTLPFAFSLTVAGALVKAVKNDEACDGSGHRSGWSWCIGECRSSWPSSSATVRSHRGLRLFGPDCPRCREIVARFPSIVRDPPARFISFVLCLRCGDRSGGGNDLVAVS